MAQGGKVCADGQQGRGVVGRLWARESPVNRAGAEKLEVLQ